MVDIATLSANSAWWSRLDIAALFVVTIGVVLEGIAEWLPKERRETRCMTALTRTGWLILVLALIVEFVAQRNKDASDALIIAALNDRAEESRSRNLALEAEIAPRKVSDDEIKSLIDGLKPFAGRPVSVKSYLGDSEGRRLLMILSTVLSRAGLKVTPGYWNFDASPQMKLLGGLELDSPPEQKDLADALQNSFSKMSLGIRPQWYAVADGTPLTLYIGVKPFQIPGITPP
jgi:hypothetical protein